MTRVILVVGVLLSVNVFAQGTGASPPEAPPSPVAGCVKDTDCKGDRICEVGTCQAPPPPSNAPLVCNQDSECPGTLVCTNSVCAVAAPPPSPRGSQSPPLPKAEEAVPSVAAPSGTSTPPPILRTTETDGAKPAAESATVDPEKPLRRGFASKFAAMLGGLVYEFDTPGYESSSDSDLAFVESAAIGGYVKVDKGMAFALLLAEHYAIVDGASYGTIGGGVRMSSSRKNSPTFSMSMGLGFVSFDGGSGDTGFGLGLDGFLPFSNGIGINVGVDLIAIPMDGGTTLTMATFAAGLGFER